VILRIFKAASGRTGQGGVSGSQRDNVRILECDTQTGKHPSAPQPQSKPTTGSLVRVSGRSKHAA